MKSSVGIVYACLMFLSASLFDASTLWEADGDSTRQSLPSRTSFLGNLFGKGIREAFAPLSKKQELTLRTNEGDIKNLHPLVQQDPENDDDWEDLVKDKNKRRDAIVDTEALSPFIKVSPPQSRSPSPKRSLLTEEKSLSDSLLVAEAPTHLTTPINEALVNLESRTFIQKSCSSTIRLINENSFLSPCVHGLLGVSTVSPSSVTLYAFKRKSGVDGPGILSNFIYQGGIDLEATGGLKNAQYQRWPIRELTVLNEKISGYQTPCTYIAVRREGFREDVVEVHELLVENREHGIVATTKILAILNSMISRLSLAYDHQRQQLMVAGVEWCSSPTSARLIRLYRIDTQLYDSKSPSSLTVAEALINESILAKSVDHLWISPGGEKIAILRSISIPTLSTRFIQVYQMNRTGDDQLTDTKTNFSIPIQVAESVSFGLGFSYDSSSFYFVNQAGVVCSGKERLFQLPLNLVDLPTLHLSSPKSNRKASSSEKEIIGSLISSDSQSIFYLVCRKGAWEVNIDQAKLYKLNLQPSNVSSPTSPTVYPHRMSFEESNRVMEWVDGASGKVWTRTLATKQYQVYEE